MKGSDFTDGEARAQGAAGDVRDHDYLLTFKLLDERQHGGGGSGGISGEGPKVPGVRGEGSKRRWWEGLFWSSGAKSGSGHALQVWRLRWNLWFGPQRQSLPGGGSERAPWQVWRPSVIYDHTFLHMPRPLILRPRPFIQRGGASGSCGVGGIQRSLKATRGARGGVERAGLQRTGTGGGWTCGCGQVVGEAHGAEAPGEGLRRPRGIRSVQPHSELQDCVSHDASLLRPAVLQQETQMIHWVLSNVQKVPQKPSEHFRRNQRDASLLSKSTL